MKITKNSTLGIYILTLRILNIAPADFVFPKFKILATAMKLPN